MFNYGPNEAGARWLATEVWPLVTRAVPGATLWLVGMHPTAAVRELASDPTVRVTGAVPQVQPYLWRSAVAAAPLQLARGIQNKVLEALAAGLPCVVTPQVLEGLPDAARPGCRVAADPAGFAGALIELLGTPAGRAAPHRRRRRVGASGLGRAARADARSGAPGSAPGVHNRRQLDESGELLAEVSWLSCGSAITVRADDEICDRRC